MKFNFCFLAVLVLCSNDAGPKPQRLMKSEQVDFLARHHLGEDNLLRPKPREAFLDVSGTFITDPDGFLLNNFLRHPLSFQLFQGQSVTLTQEDPQNQLYIYVKSGQTDGKLKMIAHATDERFESDFDGRTLRFPNTEIKCGNAFFVPTASVFAGDSEYSNRGEPVKRFQLLPEGDSEDASKGEPVERFELVNEFEGNVLLIWT